MLLSLRMRRDLLTTVNCVFSRITWLQSQLIMMGDQTKAKIWIIWYLSCGKYKCKAISLSPCIVLLGQEWLCLELMVNPEGIKQRECPWVHQLKHSYAYIYHPWQDQLIEDWIKLWYNNWDFGELKMLEEEDWFTCLMEKGNFCWNVAPVAGEAAWNNWQNTYMNGQRILSFFLFHVCVLGRNSWEKSVMWFLLFSQNTNFGINLCMICYLWVCTSYPCCPLLLNLGCGYSNKQSMWEILTKSAWNADC